MVAGGQPGGGGSMQGYGASETKGTNSYHVNWVNLGEMTFETNK